MSQTDEKRVITLKGATPFTKTIKPKDGDLFYCGGRPFLLRLQWRGDMVGLFLMHADWKDSTPFRDGGEIRFMVPHLRLDNTLDENRKNRSYVGQCSNELTTCVQTNNWAFDMSKDEKQKEQQIIEKFKKKGKVIEYNALAQPMYDYIEITIAEGKKKSLRVEFINFENDSFDPKCYRYTNQNELEKRWTKLSDDNATTNVYGLFCEIYGFYRFIVLNC